MSNLLPAPPSHLATASSHLSTPTPLSHPLLWTCIVHVACRSTRLPSLPPGPDPEWESRPGSCPPIHPHIFPCSWYPSPWPSFLLLTQKSSSHIFLIQCNQDAHMSGHLQIRLLLEGVHMRTLVTPVKSEMLLHPRWASSNWSERLRLS